MPTFKIRTLGCKVNQFESEALTGLLIAAGWQQVSTGPADLYVVNTCAVTAKSAAQSRQYLRHCRRENPRARVIATGCYATVEEEAVSRIDAVDRIVNHAAKHEIPDLAAELLRSPSSPIGRDSDGQDGPDRVSFFPTAMPVIGSRARPALKIQDGCSAFCTYCIVPYARGASVSMQPELVLTALRRYAAAGFDEVVLTGIHLGAYGLDLTPADSLYRLLVRIDQAAVVGRIRLSSIEPLELSDEIIELASRSDRLCRHFHIPLQSGSDDILKRMGRPYTAGFFADRVDRIKTVMPEAAVGVDVLVGFPGESDRDFERTLSLIDDLPVSYLHVFPFSPRPGTPAAGFSDKVPLSVIRERCRLLRQISENHKQQFCGQQKGRTASIRVEDKRDRVGGQLKGVTSNYLTVLFEGEDRLMNENVSVIIGDRIDGLRVRGTPV